MNKPLISFVTCAYNQAADIFYETAKSVVPHLAHAEWIVIDDGSTQAGYDVLANVLRSVTCGSNVHLLSLNANSGLSVARNAGIKLATGEWIVVLDSDDLAPSDLGATLSLIPKKTTLVAGSSIYFRSEAEFELRKVSRYSKLFKGRCQSPLNPFFWYDFYYHGIIARREVFHRLGGYNPNYRVGEDQDILIRFVLAEGERRVHFTDKLVYYYRENLRGVCATQADAVYAGYCETMLRLMGRVEDHFKQCRYSKATILDGATVDEYEYFHEKFGWLKFDHALSLF